MIASDNEARTGIQAGTGSLCVFCGRPLPRSFGRTPRRLHREFSDAAKFLRAARRALAEVEFGDDGKAAEARRFAAGVMNAIPCNWSRPRDRRGRFVGAEV